MPSHPTLTDLLERARRRLFGQLVLDKGALALVIGMAAVILLLLAGTQILDWYWPVLVVAVSLGVGIYRLRKSLPSLYVLAQRIDRRLGLADSLSTAIHFAAHPDTGSRSGLRIAAPRCGTGRPARRYPPSPAALAIALSVARGRSGPGGLRAFRGSLCRHRQPEPGTFAAQDRLRFLLRPASAAAREEPGQAPRT